MKTIIAYLAFFAIAGCSPEGYPPSNLQTTDVTENAVKMPLGKFLLIRLSDQHGAIKFTKTIAKGDNGVEYTWYYQSDRSGSFVNNTAKHGQGEVFEKYKRVKKTDDGWEVENDGGVLHITCDKLTVEWSSGNWIYFDSPSGLMEIAITTNTSIEDINYLDEAIIWHKEKISQQDN